MKEILISIQPKWCELIASGKKILEVRKTRPKLKTPFKCYIYETKGLYKSSGSDHLFCGEGKVIGQFLCKSILPISVTYSDPNNKIALREFPYTCLSDKEIMDYLGNGKQGWGWHISDLVIYDKPKELSEFRYYNPIVKLENGYPIPIHEIERPPQSWCYVKG